MKPCVRAILSIVLIVLVILVAFVLLSMRVSRVRAHGGSEEKTVEGHSDRFYAARDISAADLAAKDWSGFVQIVRPLVDLPYEVAGTASIGKKAVAPGSALVVGDRSAVRHRYGDDIFEGAADIQYHTHPVRVLTADNIVSAPASSSWWTQPSAQDLASARANEGIGFVPWHAVAAPEGVYVYKTDAETFKTDPLIEVSYKSVWDRASGISEDDRKIAIARKEAVFYRAFADQMESESRLMTPTSALRVIKEQGFDVALVPWS